MERFFAAGLLLISFAFPVHANEALLKHTTAVSQAMSALYMKAVTEGSSKYERDLTFYTQSADNHMLKVAASELTGAQALSATWAALKDRINVEYTPDYEWNVRSDIRRDFRKYQADLYEIVNQNIAQYQQPPLMNMLALTQVETIIARFFDVSTALTGNLSLSLIDREKVDSPIIGAQFNQIITDMIKTPFYHQHAKNLSSAHFKWKFIEKTVVNFSNESAHFLVYATKNNIHKALSMGQEVGVN